MNRYRKLLLGSVSHRAIVFRMAGGINPRTVMWRRQITGSVEPAKPVGAANAA